MTITVEFRLYFDDNGDVLYYTCDKPEGNYIVIDRQTYAECRHDIKVVDGRIVHLNQVALISKLVPSESGTKCSTYDVNIITSDNTDIQYWKVKTNEFKYS
jgi:hypothetical protein